MQQCRVRFIASRMGKFSRDPLRDFFHDSYRLYFSLFFFCFSFDPTGARLVAIVAHAHHGNFANSRIA